MGLGGDGEVLRGTRAGEQATKTAKTRWRLVLVWLLRLLSVFWMAKGLMAWAVIFGVSGDDQPPFESRLLSFQAIIVYFAVIDLVAAVGLWLTALNARFRDVGIMVPFMLQVWMFMSPVAYSAKVVPQHLKLLYSLNPMVGVIDGFRWALLGKAPPDPMAMAASLLVMLLLLVTGLAYFRRAERTFADVV